MRSGASVPVVHGSVTINIFMLLLNDHLNVLFQLCVNTLVNERSSRNELQSKLLIILLVFNDNKSSSLQRKVTGKEPGQINFISQRKKGKKENKDRHFFYQKSFILKKQQMLQL